MLSNPISMRHILEVKWRAEPKAPLLSPGVAAAMRAVPRACLRSKAYAPALVLPQVRLTLRPWNKDRHLWSRYPMLEAAWLKSMPDCFCLVIMPPNHNSKDRTSRSNAEDSDKA